MSQEVSNVEKLIHIGGEILLITIKTSYERKSTLAKRIIFVAGRVNTVKDKRGNVWISQP